MDYQPSLENDVSEICLENGLLSYENPNYHLDPKSIKHNQNLFEEIMSESKHSRGGSETKVIMSNRKSYACMDIGSMGVDLKENFEKSKILTDTNQYPDNKLTEQQTASEGSNGNGEKSDEMCEKYVIEEKPEGVKDEYDEDGGKRDDSEKVKCSDKKNGIEKLPPGWERHEDNGGCYFWHIKSGTIQREMPLWPKELKTPLIPPTSPIPGTDGNSFSVAFNSLYNYGSSETSSINSANIGNTSAGNSNSQAAVARSTSSHTLDLEQENKKRKDLEYKRRSYPLKSETDKPIRFAVRSLGWVEIAEEDLTPERSSKAVNKCILDLSFGKNDLLDVVGRWGDGKDLFLDLDEGALKLIDPENLTVLNTQPIHTIRVWGVGRDNGSDFAYVARDRLTRVHMCHVFRCETAARTIANTLRDICKKIMIERSVQIDGNNGPNAKRAVRPTDLPTENRQRRMRHAQSFPTPMEEPKKVLRAQYLGSTEVQQAVGMNVINDAIEKMSTEVAPENWVNVNVSISPSVIAIRPTGDDDQTIVEARVRYLSFLGIGKNVKNCAFIVHTAQDKFIAHVFRCEPSSGALCKTIEAACKLRYQKCLDAHPPNSRTSTDSQSPNSKGIGETLKNIMNTLTFKKDGSSS
ncbi:hypothetical protein PVAND_002871 [Polypedilum vanderplanki]|uniref:PID domain-containing protein n=1 Tax=Polypedilum vanderplanki TaxID=319348 RepID=A0A9J6BSB9_POLVA|nr:hypothetical protein PVAND_002871 [Polypedilum vanderplanki]